MTNPGSEFLHKRNPSLHSSEEVEASIDYLRQNGEHIPNSPSEKITAYLGFLADRDYVNDGILTGDKCSIERQIEAQIIQEDEVPASYFELQRRIARERGEGELNITPQRRDRMIQAVRADQRASLNNWVEYLGGNDGGYPDWFKTYTWTSVTKMGSYDKAKNEFQRRSRGTTTVYPDLNREALAYVYDAVQSSLHGEASNPDQKLEQLLEARNFSKLYAHALKETQLVSPEKRDTIVGSWTQYHQTQDSRVARRLADSLKGHSTNWCTASENVATNQLGSGDFHIYYTEDEDGKDTVPRVAIRMEFGNVAEVRGVDPHQELEPMLMEVVEEKLTELPGSEEYQFKVEDMKKLTEIEGLFKDNPEVELSDENLRFLLELDHRIKGFGYGGDPRVGELQNQIKQDVGHVLKPGEYAEFIRSSGMYADNLRGFTKDHFMEYVKEFGLLKDKTGGVRKLFRGEPDPSNVNWEPLLHRLPTYKDLDSEAALILFKARTPLEIFEKSDGFKNFKNLDKKVLVELLHSSSGKQMRRQDLDEGTLVEAFPNISPSEIHEEFARAGQEPVFDNYEELVDIGMEDSEFEKFMNSSYSDSLQ